MTEDRKNLIQEYIHSFHQYMRLMGSTILCPEGKQVIPKSQLVLMYILLENHNMTIKEIAAQLRSTSSAATQLVEHLTQTGLVERIENSTDRRKVTIALTADGVREIMSYKQDLIVRMDGVFAGISDEALISAIEFQQNVIGYKDTDTSEKGV